jgi:hypothetical protein
MILGGDLWGVILRRDKGIETVRRDLHRPRLREDQPPTGAVPRHAARRHRSVGDDPVRQIRLASAAPPLMGTSTALGVIP